MNLSETPGQVNAGARDIPRAKALAKACAERFHQDSVMVVNRPVPEWTFDGP